MLLWSCVPVEFVYYCGFICRGSVTWVWDSNCRCSRASWFNVNRQYVRVLGKEANTRQKLIVVCAGMESAIPQSLLLVKKLSGREIWLWAIIGPIIPLKICELEVFTYLVNQNIFNFLLIFFNILKFGTNFLTKSIHRSKLNTNYDYMR